MASNLAATEARLVSFIAEHTADPLGYVKVAFPWGSGDLKESQGPRIWQTDILSAIGRHLQDPATRFTPLQLSVASGHDIGKSALISMIIQWALSTRADTKVIVTANTDTQLRTKTWPEVTKWFRLALNAHWFKTTATAVASVSPEHERTWRADAIPWSDTSSESFAGLHNKGRRIVVVFDEASAIADKIWEVTEGALIDEETEIIWLAFGNPTRNSGRFRECFGRLKHRWLTRQIDSRTVEGTNKQQLANLVADYGEDSDFVRVRVKGEFPRAGTMQFISHEVVERARQRPAEAHLHDPLVMGVDVARFGGDESIVCLRRGRDARSIPWESFRNVDTMTLAARVMELNNIHRPDAIFVDGGGVGGGVVDRLRQLGLNPIEVQFGAAADRGTLSVNPAESQVAYANKRAEIWGAMREWLKGGMIPDDPDLASELTSVEYGYAIRNGRDAILLEKKADMKKRGLSSPDQADALAVTLSYPVISRQDHALALTGRHDGQGNHTYEYSPLARDRVREELLGKRH